MDVWEIFRIHALLPGFRVQSFPSPPLRCARAVNKDVDWPQQLLGLRGCGLRRGWIGEVRLCCDDFETFPCEHLTRFFQILFSTSGNGDTRAFCRECARAREPNTFAP